MNFIGMEWQRTGGDNWVFGVPVRGLVRERLAEVYFDSDLKGGKDYGWVWFVPGDPWMRGVVTSLTEAVAKCEAILLDRARSEKVG